jgi:hypothetical protein
MSPISFSFEPRPAKFSRTRAVGAVRLRTRAEVIVVTFPAAALPMRLRGGSPRESALEREFPDAVLDAIPPGRVSIATFDLRRRRRIDWSPSSGDHRPARRSGGSSAAASALT